MKKIVLLVTLIVIFSSCWFGKKTLPEKPVRVVFVGILNSNSNIQKSSLSTRESLEKKIIDYINGSGEVRLVRGTPLDHLIQPEDTSLFANDTSAVFLFQLQFQKEAFEIERSSPVPYIVHKPKIKHVWEFGVYLWPKGGTNFTYAAPVKGEYIISSHTDVIDFDATDPVLYVPAPEKERAREESLQNFAYNVINIIKHSVPKGK